MTIHNPVRVEQVSATEANRRFSELLRGVREGRSYIITHHGLPVARFEPPSADAVTAAREEARRALFARLEAQPVQNLPKFTRDDFYD